MVKVTITEKSPYTYLENIPYSQINFEHVTIVFLLTEYL